MEQTHKEYIVAEVRYSGTLIHTTMELETELDMRGKMGWCLHTITYLELTTNLLHAICIYERETND